MLSHSPYGGIDLDHSVQRGTLLPWAKDIVAAMDTYGEYSPSWNKAEGTGGVHLLVAGKPPGSKKVGNIEVYGEKHYLTITTNHLPGTPATINSRQEALDALSRNLTPPVEKRLFQNTSGGMAGETSLLNCQQKQHTTQCYSSFYAAISPDTKVSPAQTLY